MAQVEDSDSKKAFKVAVRLGVTVFCIVFCGSLVRPLVNVLFGGQWHADWRLILISSVSGGVLVVLWVFGTGYFTFHAARPLVAILDRDPSLSLKPNEAMSGFVAMEYYGLILNRTFVVFVAQNALYGWKAEGSVSSDRPGFYEPYQEMLNDPELMRDFGVVSDLSKLKGGFVIQGSEIASVEASYKSKWGMGRIAHSGRIRIVLTNGKTREFIALGAVSPDSIRDKILSVQTVSSGSSRIVNGGI